MLCRDAVLGTKLTQEQRFVYALLTLVFVTIFALIVLQVYTVQIFIVLLVIEFLGVIELTDPRFRAGWRRNIVAFMVICLIVFVILIVQQALPFLH